MVTDEHWDVVVVGAGSAGAALARNRSNFTIVGNALVDRVTFDGTVANGVRARLPGKGWTNLSADEVVLCAGDIHSPGILIHSGTGPGTAAARTRRRSPS
jgi:choline dehydrogenase-like flavoprotein